MFTQSQRKHFRRTHDTAVVLVSMCFNNKLLKIRRMILYLMNRLKPFELKPLNLSDSRIDGIVRRSALGQYVANLTYINLLADIVRR